MSSFKRWASICTMVVVFVLFLCVNAYGAAAQTNGICGSWECIVETDNAEDFIFSLYFTEPGDVTYVAGWYQSEIASTYAGRFTIEGEDVLKLEMADIESSDTLIGTYSFGVSDGVLLLTKQSGDSLSYLFGAGEPLAFTNTLGYQSGQTLTIEQAMNLFYEKYGDAELFHPGELDTRVGDAHFYGFACDGNGSFYYVWVNSMTGGVEFADEIENYTGEGVSANTADMSDGELTDYLLASAPEAYERVVVMRNGLTALVTGETTMLSNGVCRDVRLGTDAEISFATAATYTISPFGSIYEYDPVKNAWIAVYVKPTD